MQWLTRQLSRGVRRVTRSLARPLARPFADPLIDGRYLLETFLANTPDHVYFKDAEGRFTQISRSLARWMGVESETDALGLTDFDFFADEHASHARADELTIMETGQPIVDLEEREVWPDGRITWVSTTKVPLRSRQGEVIGIFGLSRDITARKLAEQRAREQADELQRLTNELEDLAIHDPLTGLYNRRGVDRIGARALARARRDGHDVCVLFIDVDGLKEVNDSRGHAAGDRLLVDVAKVLRDAVRTADIVGRIGGDEFTAILTGDPVPDPETLRGRLESAMADLPSADRLVSVSIGIAMATADDAQPTLDELLAAADRAMYDVKRRRRRGRGE